VSDSDTQAPPTQTPERSTGSRKRRRRRSRARLRRFRPAFQELPVVEAAKFLGRSPETLWAFLRRNEQADGTVDLGGGVVAIRVGTRQWRIRIPVVERSD